MKKFILYFVAFSMLTAQSFAFELPKNVKTNTAVVSKFQQRIQFQVPKDWRKLNHSANGNTYLIDFIPKDEPTPNFTNMFAIIAFKGAAKSNPKTIDLLNALLQPQFKSCLGKYIFKHGSPYKLDGYETIKTLFICPEHVKDTPYGFKKGESEIIYSLIIRGKEDIYFVKRIIRGKSIPWTNIPINMDNADLFLLNFLPIKICDLMKQGGKQTCE